MAGIRSPKDALHEMAQKRRVGILIEEPKVPMRPEVRAAPVYVPEQGRTGWQGAARPEAAIAEGLEAFFAKREPGFSGRA